MPSKLSIHIRDYPDGIWDVVRRMQPRVVKVFNHTSDMNVDTLKRVAKPLVVFRQFTKNNDFQVHSADEFVAELARDGGGLSKLAGKGILWEGINEPGIGQDGSPADIEKAKALNAWYVRFADLMHQRGEKVAGFSWSTGNPTDKQLKWIIPLLTDAAAAVDAHAFHEYAKPRSQTPTSDWGRYRLFEQALPPHARKPVVITEAGVDDLGDPGTSGWAVQMTAPAYIDLLARYDEMLAADDYVLGATVYTLKDPDWPSFEIEGEALGRLADYMASRGGGTVLGPVWPVPNFEVAGRGEEEVIAYAFTVEPDAITAGQSARLSWQVRGATRVLLDGSAVTLQGAATVWPATTTGYRLHIEFNDGSHKDLNVVVVVDAAARGEAVAAPSRPPIVTLSDDNLARLRTYPRPPQDNGIGLHFHLDLSDHHIAETVKNLKSIRATWTLIYASDELQAERAARACFQAGIMPVVRISKLIDEGFDPVPYVEAVRRAWKASDFPGTDENPPLYIQIYNEPEDGREWENTPSSHRAQVFGRNWAGQADRVLRAGGRPGLQVLSRPPFDAAVDAVAAMGRQVIWDRAFFVHHNYGQNHPPAYPYDARSQADNPGITIQQDDTAALKFLTHAVWMQERLGFVLPLIGGEGGWWEGNDEDKRYAKVDWTLQAEYTRAMYEALFTGVLANGEPLPDYLFSITAWIAGSFRFASQNWWGNILRKDGKITDTIEAMQRMPVFVRRFSWDGEGAPPPHVVEPPPHEEDSPPPQEPPLAPSETETQWDARLDELGVGLTRSTEPGAWRLVSARYQDENEAGGKHHVFIRAENADGSPAAGVRFVVDWVGRRPEDNPGFTTTNAQGEGDVPIFIQLHPDKKDGIQFAQADGAPSDAVSGMGLPNNRHVCFLLTFRRQ